MKTQDHYPVKRHGQRRHLDPNWPGIAWLEATTLEDAAITYRHRDELCDGLEILVTPGRFFSGAGNTRPMIEVLHTRGTSMAQYTQPCPDCLDFTRSWNCRLHSDERARPIPVHGRQRGVTRWV